MIIIKTDNGPVVVEPDAPKPPKPQFSFTWIDSNGAEWDLVHGPAWILSGARGFGLPAPQHWLRESPGLDGASWEGLRLPPREVYMPIELSRRDDLIGLDRDFFAGMNPRREGRLRVTTPEGTWREITCRYAEGAEGEYELDPHLASRVVYPIRLIAPDPYWCGPPVGLPIREEDTQPFFPGPPFHISASISFTNASVTNPGDEPAYPVWKIHGPFSSFSVGVGDSQVSMTLRKETDEFVEVDMRPGFGTFIDETGADVSNFVTGRSFEPIAPGDVTLSVAVAGEGDDTSVDLAFIPRYWRAW